MTPLFYIAHATPGRTRIRWAGESDQKHIVTELASDIANLAGVINAEPRTATGSIIIQHDGLEWPDLESALGERLPIKFTASQAISRNGADAVNDSIDTIDDALKHMNVDFNSFLMLMLCALSVVQALRGQVMSSSVSFLWYAFTLASMIRDRDNKHRDSDTDESV